MPLPCSASADCRLTTVGLMLTSTLAHLFTGLLAIKLSYSSKAGKEVDGYTGCYRWAAAQQSGSAGNSSFGNLLT